MHKNAAEVTHTHKDDTWQEDPLPHSNTDCMNATLVTKHLSHLLVTCSLSPYDIDPHAHGSWSRKRYSDTFLHPDDDD